MASKPRFFAVTLLVWLTVGAAALVTGLASAGDRFWLGDMSTFFLPQLVLVLYLLLAFAAILRRWIAAIVLAVLIVINAGPLAIATIPTADTASGSTVRIVSANVLFNNATPERFAETIAALDPDIILTQEARFDWPDILRQLPGYPHLAGPEAYRWNSNLVLSRYPLRASRVAGMETYDQVYGGGQALRVEVYLPAPARPLVVYDVHAPTPRTPEGWQRRQLYLEAVAKAIAAEPEGTQVVLGGDWNTPVWSPTYARTLIMSGMKATERSAWPPATRLFIRRDGITWLGTPIDHVAVSSDIGVADQFLGPDFGSDHLPVVVDLKLP